MEWRVKRGKEVCPRQMRSSLNPADRQYIGLARGKLSQFLDDFVGRGKDSWPYGQVGECLPSKCRRGRRGGGEGKRLRILEV